MSASWPLAPRALTLAPRAISARTFSGVRCGHHEKRRAFWVLGVDGQPVIQQVEKLFGCAEKRRPYPGLGVLRGA